MPAAYKVTAAQVQEARGRWWQYHYAAREHIKSLDPETRLKYAKLSDEIAPPYITVYGGLPHNYPPTKAYKLAATSGLDVAYVCPWYCTDDGWERFRKLFESLPEPVDLHSPPCVEIGAVLLFDHYEARYPQVPVDK